MKCPQMLKCVCYAKNLAYNFMHSLKASQGEILVMALFCQGDLDLAKARSMTHGKVVAYPKLDQYLFDLDYPSLSSLHSISSV